MHLLKAVMVFFLSCAVSVISQLFSMRMASMCAARIFLIVQKCAIYMYNEHCVKNQDKVDCGQKKIVIQETLLVLIVRHKLAFLTKMSGFC